MEGVGAEGGDEKSGKEALRLVWKGESLTSEAPHRKCGSE